MSNSLAIAAVTSTIRYVLERALQVPHPGPVGGAGVTTLRPDQLADSELVTTPGINVYLYDVQPNAAWNLRDLPTRRDDGTLSRRPVAALDLHYLLTCYGEEASLDAQRLLGRAVLALAVTPMLTRDVVEAAVEAYEDDTDTDFLDASDLAEQLERVKVAPYRLTLEESAKLWSIFSTPHQLAQTYVATAVLLEADVAHRTALPVRHRVVAVRAGGSPRLSRLVTESPGGLAATGGRVVVEGTGLLAPAGARTLVRVGPAALTPDPGGTGLRLEVTLDDTVPAGLQGVRVQHRRDAEGDRPPRVLATSTMLPLLVRPTPTVTATSPDVVLRLSPPLQPGQRATVLLTLLTPGAAENPDAVTLTLGPVPRESPPQSQVVVARADVPDGHWLVRVDVDGVESVPDLVGETYAAPALTLP